MIRKQPVRLQSYSIQLVVDQSTERIAVIARDHTEAIVSEAYWPQQLTNLMLCLYWPEMGDALFSDLTTAGNLDSDRIFSRVDLEKLGFNPDDFTCPGTPDLTSETC